VLAAIYARVSLDEQVEQYSLPSQLRAMREFAQQKNYATPDNYEFVDDGYLGGDLDRPELERLRGLVRTRHVDVVIAYDQDRLSRMPGHIWLLREECERYGVKLEFVTAPAAENAEARMMQDFKAIFSQYELEKIRERTSRGRREKARQGFVVGGRIPFGYRYLGKKEGERGRLVVDEHETSVVREIFAWASDGASIREIVTRLNARGVKPKHAARWGKSSVCRLLKNETYIGQAYYNRRQRMRPAELTEKQRFRRNKKTLLRMRPESDWISLPAPAIVERELFDRVQVRMNRNRELRSGRPSSNYMLRGLCRCGHCGRKIHGCPSHGRRYYRCAGRDRLAIQRCTAGLVHADKLEASVWRAIAEAFQDGQTLRALIERNLAELQAGQAQTQDPENQLKADLEKLRRREFRAAQALLDPDLREQYDTFKAALSETRAQRSRIESELQAIERRGKARDVALEDVDTICRSIKRAIAQADETRKLGFIQRLVERVTITGKNAEVLCSIPQSDSNRSHCPNPGQAVDIPKAGFNRSHSADDRAAGLGKNDAR
jgi:site-specific DNA recombinase